MTFQTLTKKHASGTTQVYYFGYKQFVCNSVNEILDLTTREMWRYCPSPCNPADIGSKGLPASKLKNNSLWLHGPPWLVLPEESWPADISVDRLEASDEVMQEINLI